MFKIVLFFALASLVVAQESRTAKELIASAEAQESQKNWADASLSYSKLLELYGEHPDFATARESVSERSISASLNAQKWAEAQKAIERHLAWYPKSTKLERLELERSRCLLFSSKASAAIDALHRWQSLYPHSSSYVDSLWILGAAFIQSPTPKAAIPIFKDARLKAASLERANAGLLQSYVASKLWKEAYALIQFAEPIALGEKGSDHISLHSLVASGLESEGNDELACYLRQKIVSLSPPEVVESQRLRWAQSLMRAKRFREALAVLEKCQNRSSDSSTELWIHQSILSCLERLERWTEAAEMAAQLKEATSDLQQKTAFALRYIHLLQKTENNVVLVHAIDSWLKDYPNSQYADRLRYTAAVTYLKMGEPAEAIARLSDLERLNSKSPLLSQSRLIKAQAMFGLQQTEKALELLRSLTADDSLKAYRSLIWHRIGLCHLQLKQFDKAFQSGEKAKALASEESQAVDACLLLASVCEAKGDAAKALSVLESSEISGSHPIRLKLKAAGIYRRLKDWNSLHTCLNEICGSEIPPESAAELISGWLDLARVKGKDVSLEPVEAYWMAHAEGMNLLAVEAGIQRWTAEQLRRGEDVAVLLEQWRKKCEASSAPALQARLTHALADVLRLKNPMRATELDLTALSKIESSRATPSELLAAGRAVLHSGTAENKYFHQLEEQYPNTVACDAGRMALAIKQELSGHKAAAEKLRDLVLSGGRKSEALAQAYRGRAEHRMEQAKYTDALEDWEQYLKMPGVRGRAAAEALNAMAAARVKMGDVEKAIATYQRIYVVYFGQCDLSARAYWESGVLFERLNRIDAAKKTFEELLRQEALASSAEAVQARARLQSMEKES